jgi:hypothetical protein
MIHRPLWIDPGDLGRTAVISFSGRDFTKMKEIYLPLPLDVRPTESQNLELAWCSVKGAVNPFLGDTLTQLFLGELGFEGDAGFTEVDVRDGVRANALRGFARVIKSSPNRVDQCVENHLADVFDTDQQTALVAFAGMVRKYPGIVRSNVSK